MTPHTRTLLLLLLALVPAFGGAVSFQATENLPELSFDQRVWLEDKGELRLGIPIGRPPLAYQNDFDRILGTESGYARLLERKLGIPVTMVGGTPMMLEEALEQGEIDAVSMVSSDTWSSRQYRFTRPYMQVSYGLYARRDNAQITSLGSLDGHRIVFLDGDHYTFELLDPVASFTPVAARTMGGAMNRLLDEEADAFLAPIPVGDQYLENNNVTAIERVQALDEHPMALAYAVPFEEGLLRGALDAAIASMTNLEHRNIQGAWVRNNAISEEQQRELVLTAGELAWLDEHPDLKVGLRTAWPPAEFDDEDRIRGLIPDLLDLIEAKLDYEFERVPMDTNTDPEDLLKDGQVDVLPALARTSERQDRFLFTRSYVSFPVAIVVRENHRFVGDLSELKEERVGVVREMATQQYLRRYYPSLRLEPVASIEQGLRQVSKSELDVMVTQIPGVSYNVSRLGLQNIRITSITPFQYDLRLAVDGENPQLVGILNKTLASLDRDALDKVYNKWIKLDVEKRADYTVVRRVAFIAALVLFAFLYWNRKLSQEVNERLRSEQALRRSEDELLSAKQRAEDLADEAEEANRAKSEFLANMSHEIRTPMNAVIGYTELLERTITDERQQGYLASIKAGSRSLLTLINDILDLSRVEAGKMRLEYGPLDLGRLLEDVRHIFEIRAREKGLDLVFELDDNLPPVMVLDETRLRQVLFNLVGNAIKFTDKGEVRVRTHWQEADQPVLGLEVIDTGIGIPEEQQARIFDAFEQQADQSSRQYGGTGLGLAISRKLVEMMNGSLSVVSAPGKGTRFRVDLYDVETALAAPGIQEETVPVLYRFREARVLIVDDNPVNRQLVRDVLEPEGLLVDEAEDGAKALQLARDWHPDLVLMDIRMPVMDGFEALAVFMEDPDLARIPLVALTASVMTTEAARIREAGFHGYLRKPVSRQDLLAELAHYLDYEEVSHEEGADSREPPALTPWAELGPDEQQSVRHEIQRTLVPRATSLKDSGDPEALQAFGQDVIALARSRGVEELVDYARQLLAAIEGFDLDRVQYLLGLLADDSVLP
jgi:two-component system sensor histidine kinase EvgS